MHVLRPHADADDVSRDAAKQREPRRQAQRERSLEGLVGTQHATDHVVLNEHLHAAPEIIRVRVN